MSRGSEDERRESPQTCTWEFGVRQPASAAELTAKHAQQLQHAANRCVDADQSPVAQRDWAGLLGELTIQCHIRASYVVLVVRDSNHGEKDDRHCHERFLLAATAPESSAEW